MDPYQWMEKSIKALEAMAPSKDICQMTLCLTKSEWASWVQAVGSIAAIYVAMRISARQAVREKERAARLAYKRVVSFAGLLREVLFDMNKAQLINLQLVRNWRAVLNEVLEEARGVQNEQLSAEWVALSQSARATVAQLIETLRVVEELNSDKLDNVDVPVVEAKYLASMVEDMTVSLHSLLDKAKEFNYVESESSPLKSFWSGFKDGIKEQRQSK